MSLEHLVLKYAFSDNLYFINVDFERTHLEVCQLDGKHRKVLLSTKTETPTSIAVDPISRYLYWVDQGQQPSIQVCFCYFCYFVKYIFVFSFELSLKIQNFFSFLIKKLVLKIFDRIFFDCLLF